MRRQGGSDDPRQNHQGKIQFVDYSTRHIVVKVKGFGTIKRVNVQRGIQLGTTDRPVILRGDVATIFQKPSGRWVCSSITHKDHCATSPLPGEVIVDTSNEYISSNSIITQQLSSLELPLLDLRFPPIESLGQLTLSDFRFPDTHTFLCGLPPCTDCGTPGLGKAIVISTDVDHPFCWKFDFRLGGCTGSPALSDTLTYETTPVSATRPPVFHTVGDYAYLFTPFDNATGKLHILNISDITNLVEVGTLTLAIADSAGGGASLGIQVYGNYAFINVNYRGTPTTVNIPRTYVVDVSDRTNPTLVHTENWSTAVIASFRLKSRIFTSGASVYMLVGYRLTVATEGVKVIDITTPTSPTIVGDLPRPTGSAWVTFDYGNGYFYATHGVVVAMMGKVDVYDLTTPSSPSYVGEATIGSGSSVAPLGMRVSGNYLYEVTNGDKLIIANISNPASVTVESNTDIGVDTGGDAGYDLAVCGAFVFIIVYTGLVVVYNVTDPSAPVLNASLTLSDWTTQDHNFSNAIEVTNFDLFINGQLASNSHPTLAALTA